VARSGHWIFLFGMKKISYELFKNAVYENIFKHKSAYICMKEGWIYLHTSFYLIANF